MIWLVIPLTRRLHSVGGEAPGNRPVQSPRQPTGRSAAGLNCADPNCGAPPSPAPPPPSLAGRAAEATGINVTASNPARQVTAHHVRIGRMRIRIGPFIKCLLILTGSDVRCERP